MKSLRELYRIGKGPSSSHTMGPQKAAKIFLEKNPAAKAFKVTLYGRHRQRAHDRHSHYRSAVRHGSC